MGLREWNVRALWVTDEGLKGLPNLTSRMRRLTNLTSLRLSLSPGITDAGIERVDETVHVGPLSQLFPNLVTLLQDTEFST